MSTPLPLVGRRAERSLIDHTLEAAKHGQAGALVLTGDAGIGKTRMLAYAMEVAAGFRILETRGVQADFRLGYSGLSDIITPLGSHLPGIPDPQAAALRGVLALGAPGQGDRFAVAAGCLNLLAAAAEDDALLVVVDDAHWVDESSLEALAFAARRLRGERIAMLFGARSTASEALARLATLDVHQLEGLGTGEAQMLLAACGNTGLGDAAVDEMVASTAGNPLALLEIARQPPGGSAIHPLPVAPRLEQAFGERLESLASPTRSALLVVACSATADSEAVLDALAALSLGAADLHEAEDAGLIAIRSGQIVFLHPLVRSAVYQLAAPSERRGAHRALAGALVGRSHPSAHERRCLHLAAATEGVDDGVADELNRLGEESTSSGAYLTALQAFEQAAALSSDPETRSKRLLRAAELTQAAGRIDRAPQLLDAAEAHTRRSPLRVQVEHLRCRIEMWNGSPVEARDRLSRLGDTVAESEPLMGAYMVAHASLTSVTLGEYRLAESSSARAVELVRTQPLDFATPVLLVRAAVLAVGGDVGQARAILSEAADWLAAWDPLSTEQLLLVGALAYASMEDNYEARRIFDVAEHAAREANAIGLLPFQLSWRSVFEWRSGNWHVAYGLAHESVTLARETGWATELPHALAATALIEAGMGREQECRAHAAEAIELASATGAFVVALQAEIALALLEMTHNPRSAAVRLERAATFARTNGMGDPVLFPWASDLVEAYVRSGERENAFAAAEVLKREAERTDRPTERALAHRAAALLGDSADAEADLLAALDWHQKGTNPFEAARTLLFLGESHRRRKRKMDAQRCLHQALNIFDQLGAKPWCARTRAEIAAAGGPEAAEKAPSLEALTAQELQVALGAARGASNAEIGAQLFLSPKTVEYHLTRVYRKLGVRSRARLSRLIAEVSHG